MTSILIQHIDKLPRLSQGHIRGHGAALNDPLARGQVAEVGKIDPSHPSGDAAINFPGPASDEQAWDGLGLSQIELSSFPVRARLSAHGVVSL